MRFGMVVPQGCRLDLAGIDPLQHWGVMAGLARRADEGDAWSGIWLHDHLQTLPTAVEEATHELWAVTAALAAVTVRVRLGQVGSCLAGRHPAVLAKTAATVDVISEGRLDVGLGAIRHPEEWRAYGLTVPEFAEQVTDLREAAQIMRQAWTTGELDFVGERYRTDGGICRPLPVQAAATGRGLPLWLSCAGEPALLRVAAEEADGVHLSGDPEEFAVQSELLAQRCHEVDRDPAEIMRAGTFDVVIGLDEDDVRRRVDWYRGHLTAAGVTEGIGLSAVEELIRQPLVGTPETIVHTLQGLQAQGMGYAICYFPESAYDVSGLDLFERAVIPQLRVPGGGHHRHWPFSLP
ncbi:Flavin-dependent oxidoreductase, luciferase family (includes alkanesulfonate monooxygenase SsuD and methylene tetrahydromethanopterin reductase) [Austwickia chelonae]|uniref:Luciferase-like domain-containing protein n=2 Tax=Austwickia TaxID=1184606 RepID=K6V3S3_9MICO|nr:hypothetical protein AUCHE_02_01200 [Austwickia chelonae NBRC 105200]SEW30270.1 Flavin-dependent oxidoreductase, luciferase family (includes alkanesulfonate monooxygenase SsuD and methylene tetrahydromethanopterin reductase) [Austwickia chelonae]